MIDIDRVMNDIQRMAAIGALPDGGVSRPAMSEADLEARRYLLTRMEETGLRTWVDAAGNIFGRREPAVGAGGRAAVMIGSHIDTVPCGGCFDGVLGVIGALECVRALEEAGTVLQRPIELVAFNDEEERFLPFLGSRALMGELTAAHIEGVRDRQGTVLAKALRSAGGDPGAIASARRETSGIAAFLELHIEQGPLLERAGEPIGIVERIKGNYRWDITVEGRTDHAGAPGDGRADAFMGLQTVLEELRSLHAERGGADGTFTVGRLDLAPNIETAQPGRAGCSVDFRSSDATFLQTVEEELQHLVEGVRAENQKLRATVRPILRENPVAFNSSLIEAAERSAARRGYACRRMASGAGHDAQVLGRHMPAAMIFVPSVGGRSHCAEEHTKTEDIACGVAVLLDTVAWLAASEDALR